MASNFSPDCSKTSCTARSTRVFPCLLFLYVYWVPFPRHASTRPDLILAMPASFKASHVMAPIVPGMNRNRQEKLSERRDNIFARSALTTMPERLSLHKEGWHT